MPVLEGNIVKEVILSEKQKELVSRAKKIHEESFGLDAWFGRCLFLSWYCSKGTCDFCFRSTQKHKIKFSDNARRSRKSVFTEAIISRSANWKLEFLTGGYDVCSFDEILEIVKVCSQIFGEKLWLNLGILKREELEQLKPYVEGIVASLETSNKKLHAKVCPDKDFDEYIDLLKIAEELGFKKGLTIVLGLGESIDDYANAKQLINDLKIDRVTYYALRPVRGTPYANGPEPEDVVEWIANTRIDFPSLDIMAGTAASRIPEINYFLQAGANGFTKLPATKIFGSQLADQILAQAKDAGRLLKSEFATLDSSDWNSIVDNLSLSDKDKEELLAKLDDYKKMMSSH